MNWNDVTPEIHFANFKNPGSERAWCKRELPDFELILAIDGEFELVLHQTGERIRHSRGEALLIHPGEFHSYRAAENAPTVFFACIHFLMPNTPEPWMLPRKTATGDKFTLLTELFHRVSAEWAGSGRFRELLSNHILKEILMRLSDLSEGVPQSDSGKLRQLTDYIDLNLACHPGREELAKAFYLSKPYINRLFKSGMGESPTAYLHRRLANRGYELIFYENRSIKETAEKLGFANPFHFSRVFKDVFGIAPSHLRARNKFFTPDR